MLYLFTLFPQVFGHQCSEHCPIKCVLLSLNHMHPIQPEFRLFTYEDSAKDAVQCADFIPLDLLAEPLEKR